LVVDASVVVAALVDSSHAGRWAEQMLGSGPLAAPHLLPVETADVLRRAALAGDISVDVASMAHDDLLSVRLELFSYLPFASRVWELRANVTAYDAWYVALAESLGVALATLDIRLTRAAGPRCKFVTMLAA
jgi:predicted nucleic acid-binding protein